MIENKEIVKQTVKQPISEVTNSQTNQTNPATNTTANPYEKYDKTAKFASFEKRNDGSYYYKETIVTTGYDPILGWHKISEIVNEKDLTDPSVGLSRTATINVIFKREYEDTNEWNGKKIVWFKQQMVYSMRPDMSMNLWFKHSDGRLFIKDVDGEGFCMEIAIGDSTSNYVCKASRPVKVESIAELQELALTTHYRYNKVESSGETIENYITTV
jgi:hypothetical protein